MTWIARVSVFFAIAWVVNTEDASCSGGQESESCSAKASITSQQAAAMLQSSKSHIAGASIMADADEAGRKQAGKGQEHVDNLYQGSAEAESEATAAAQDAVKRAYLEAEANTERIQASQRRAEAAAKSKELRTAHSLHMQSMSYALSAMNKTQTPSNTELDNIMSSFIDSQASSQDKCPALLLEAKHQLNILHEHIHQLATEIQAVEMSLVTEHHQVEIFYQEINESHKWKEEEYAKCSTEEQADYKMYYILQQELLEMHQIANPNFNTQGGTHFAIGSGSGVASGAAASGTGFGYSGMGTGFSGSGAAVGAAGGFDYGAWAATHDFSAKTHKYYSTTSGYSSSSSGSMSWATSTAGSTSGGGASATTTGIYTSGATATTSGVGSTGIYTSGAGSRGIYTSGVGSTGIYTSGVGSSGIYTSGGAFRADGSGFNAYQPPIVGTGGAMSGGAFRADGSGFNPYQPPIVGTGGAMSGGAFKADGSGFYPQPTIVGTGGAMKADGSGFYPQPTIVGTGGAMSGGAFKADGSGFFPQPTIVGTGGAMSGGAMKADGSGFYPQPAIVGTGGPGYSYGYKYGTSLVQDEAHSSKAAPTDLQKKQDGLQKTRARAADARQMVDQTKKLANELSVCMTETGSGQPTAASLLEENATQYPYYGNVQTHPGSYTTNTASGLGAGFSSATSTTGSTSGFAGGSATTTGTISGNYYGANANAGHGVQQRTTGYYGNGAGSGSTYGSYGYGAGNGHGNGAGSGSTYGSYGYGASNGHANGAGYGSTYGSYGYGASNGHANGAGYGSTYGYGASSGHGYGASSRYGASSGHGYGYGTYGGQTQSSGGVYSGAYGSAVSGASYGYTAATTSGANGYAGYGGGYYGGRSSSAAATGTTTGQSFGKGYTTSTGTFEGPHTTSSTSTTGTSGSNFHSSYHSASHSSSVLHSSAHSAAMSKYYRFATATATGTGDNAGEVGKSDACQYQVHALQVVYIRAYVEITRLLAEYEIIIHQHGCREYAEEVDGTKEKDMENKIVKVTKVVQDYTAKLTLYKARIEAAYRLEMQLREHVRMLVTRCSAMSATVSSLDKVRDAIHVLGVCPGLGRITFIIPKYYQVFLEDTFEMEKHDDATIDQQMNDLCASNAPSLTETSSDPRPAIQKVYRAAETSELMLRSIQDMPMFNPASIPMMGTCPNCEGQADDSDPQTPQHVSKHYRVCWDENQPLDPFHKRTDCTDGKKAVLCVEDKDYANAGSSR